jgi:hypothetical protein
MARQLHCAIIGPVCVLLLRAAAATVDCCEQLRAAVMRNAKLPLDPMGPR